MKKVIHSFAFMLVFMLSACTGKSGYEQDTIPVRTSVAEEYFSNIEKIVASAYLGDELCEAAQQSPVFDKLKSISIIDGAGEKISFFDLPTEERSSFFKQYADLNAEALLEKFKSEPMAEDYIEAQNEMVEDVLNRHLMISKDGGESVLDDVQTFFIDLNAAAEKFSDKYVAEDYEITTKADMVYNPGKIISTYSGVAKRGDFIIALPKQGKNWLLVNNKAEMYPKGHAEIIITDVTPQLSENDRFTVGTLSDGVRLRTLAQCWLCQSNVLGVELTDYVWEGLKLKAIKRQITASAIAAFAEMFTYTPYIEDYEAVISKWVAPKHFTDATLLWWTMKTLFDVELGSWLLPTISAVDIYNSEYTYLKASVN